MAPRLRQALVLARRATSDAGHVGTPQLLVGVLDEGTNLAVGLLQALDQDVDELRAAVPASIGLGHNYLGCEHLPLALTLAPESGAGQLLRAAGVDAAGGGVKRSVP